MMKRVLLFMFLGSLSLLKGQFYDAGYRIVDDLHKPLEKGLVQKRSSSNPTACSGDTSTFPSYGSTGYSTVTVRKGSALGQFFDAPQDMTISGFRFFALAVTPTPARNIKIKLVCKLYKAGLDSLPSGVPIATDTVEVDTVQGANIPLTRITRDAYFGRDVPINFPYIITVESDSTDVSAGVVSNSWANGDGKFRNLCVGSVSGIWYRCLNLNIAGTTFNSHMQMYPFVKYSIGTDFDIKQNCYPNLDTLYFPNHSPKNIISSIYYNRYVYSNIERFCHRWNFDYRLYTNAIDGAYKPQTKSNLRIELITTMYPYTGAFCRDTSVKTIYFNPSRPTTLEEPKACRGDDAKIDIITDVNAEILWYHTPNDTGAFFKGKTLEIKNAQKNDTFYVRAVNFNCKSIFAPIYFTVNDYPQNLTIKNDSICAGATANLSASTDKGTLFWYTDPSLGKPFHTGNTYQTQKLTSDTTFYLVADNNGCQYVLGTQKIQAFVGNDFAPALPQVPSDTFFCLNSQQEIVLKAGANAQNDSLRWFSNSIGGKPIALGESYTFKGTQRGHLSAYVESWNGICGSGRTPVHVQIKDYPQIFGAQGATACENDTAELLASVPWGDLYWYENKTQSQPIYIGKTPKVAGFVGTKYYYLKSTEDACMSPSFDSVAVTFNAIPKTTLVEAPSICARDIGIMRAQTSVGNVNWYIDSLSEDVLFTGNTYNLGMTLSNRVRWFETENKGCTSDRKSLTLIVKPRPVTGFTYTIGWQHRVSCTPITSTGLTLQWFWGDGSTKTGLPALHQYEKAGEYTIRLVATSNATGCKDTVDIPVSVNHIGINRIHKSTAITTYPNPIQSGETLYIPEVQEGTLTWLELSGKEINRSEIISETSTVPIGIKEGIYLIRVETNQGTYSSKIWVRN